MSYEFYKVIHLLGIAGVLLPLGAMAQHAIAGGTKATLGNRKALLILHGISMLLIFVAGFGLIARTGVGFPGWIYAKIVIWLIFGGAVAVALRKPALARSLFYVLPILVAIATYLVNTRPF